MVGMPPSIGPMSEGWDHFKITKKSEKETKTPEDSTVKEEPKTKTETITITFQEKLETNTTDQYKIAQPLLDEDEDILTPAYTEAIGDEDQLLFFHPEELDIYLEHHPEHNLVEHSISFHYDPDDIDSFVTNTCLPALQIAADTVDKTQILHIAHHAEEVREGIYDPILMTAEHLVEHSKTLPIIGIALTAVSLVKNAHELRETLERKAVVKEFKSELTALPLYDNSISLNDLPNNFSGRGGLESLPDNKSPMMVRLAKTLQYTEGKLDAKKLKVGTSVVGGLIQLSGGATALAASASGIGAAVGAGIAVGGYGIANVPLLYRIGKCAFKTLNDTRGVNRSDHANFLYGLVLHELQAKGKINLEQLKGDAPNVAKTLDFMNKLQPPIDESSEDFKTARDYAFHFVAHLGVLKESLTENEIIHFVKHGHHEIMNKIKST